MKKRYYFCSHFVGELLSRSGAVSLPKPAHLMQPSDYLFLEDAHAVYVGTVGELLRRSVLAAADPFTA